MTTEQATDCRHCGRRIINVDGRWIDPEATGDDSVWRETCDSHDTFEAEHEPTTTWEEARVTIQLALMDPDNACLGIREAERAYDIAQEALTALVRNGYLKMTDPDGF